MDHTRLAWHAVMLLETVLQDRAGALVNWDAWQEETTRLVNLAHADARLQAQGRRELAEASWRRKRGSN